MDHNQYLDPNLPCILALLWLMTIFLTHPDEFHSDQFESLGLETFDDLVNKSTLNTIGLDHDESTFGIWVAHG